MPCSSLDKSYFKYLGKVEKPVEGKQPRYHLLPYYCLDVAAVGWQLLDSVLAELYELETRHLN